jgi:DNA-binding IclR family transcriptional regulator
MTAPTSKYSVPNLERALKILELLADHREGLIAAHIARELDVSRNSVFRICSTLIENGYLQYFRETQQLVLTRKLLGIGYRAMGEDNVVQLARSAMLELRDAVKETVVLGTLMQTDGAVLEEVPGIHHFNFRIERGARFFLHCTAPGKALLAFLDDKERDQLIDQIDFIAFNERTITTPEQLREALPQVKAEGIAYDYAEQIDGCHCIAAPVLDQYGCPVAAIWITGPSARVPISDFPTIGQHVKAAADAVSILMGYQH